MAKTKQNHSIILFNQKQVRRHWDEKKELWYFSIIDVIKILTESPRPRKYWSALKTKLDDAGSELSHKLGQLKLQASIISHKNAKQLHQSKSQKQLKN